MRIMFGIVSLMLVAVILYMVSVDEGDSLFGGSRTGSSLIGNKGSTGVAGQTLLAQAFQSTSAVYIEDNRYPPSDELEYAVKRDQPILRFENKPGIAKLTLKTINSDLIEICVKNSLKSYYCAREYQGSVRTNGIGKTWEQAQRRVARVKQQR